MCHLATDLKATIPMDGGYNLQTIHQKQTYSSIKLIIVGICCSDRTLTKKWIIWNESFEMNHLRFRLGRPKVSPENTFLSSCIKVVLKPQGDAVHVYCSIYLGSNGCSSPSKKILTLLFVDISGVYPSLSSHFVLCRHHRCPPTLFFKFPLCSLWALQRAAALSSTLCAPLHTLVLRQLTWSSQKVLVLEETWHPCLSACCIFGEVNLTVWAL